MKIKLFWGVFLSFLVANAQDVPCFEKEGLFLDSPTRLSSLGGYFHLVDASIPRPVYFVEYNPGLRIEYLYRKGVFVNIWSYRNATEGLRMSNYKLRIG